MPVKQKIYGGLSVTLAELHCIIRVIAVENTILYDIEPGIIGKKVQHSVEIPSLPGIGWLCDSFGDARKMMKLITRRIMTLQRQTSAASRARVMARMHAKSQD